MKQSIVTFKGHVGKKLALLGALAFCAMANAQAAASSNFAASDSLKLQMDNLKSDVNSIIGPAAIGLAVSIALVVIGRGLIKKFFKG